MNTTDVASVSCSLGECAVSAKGAEFKLSLWRRPRIWEHASASAEGAIQNCQEVKRCESRFQRSCMVERYIPGALPQAGTEMHLWRKQIRRFAIRTQSETSL